MVSAFKAFSTMPRRKATSASFGKLGLPKGWGMATAGTIRLAPTVKEMGVTVQMCTTGNPARSISFTIVAPQRVQVPQVEVKITPFTPAAFNSFANSAA